MTSPQAALFPPPGFSPVGKLHVFPTGRRSLGCGRTLSKEASQELGALSLSGMQYLKLETFVLERPLFYWWVPQCWFPNCNCASQRKAKGVLWARPLLLLRSAEWWRKELSVDNQHWNKTPALFQISDSDQRQTPATHDRKFNSNAYLVLESIKAKTECQSQLRNTAVCEWMDSLSNAAMKFLQRVAATFPLPSYPLCLLLLVKDSQNFSSLSSHTHICHRSIILELMQF